LFTRKIMKYLVSITILFISNSLQAACTKGYRSTIRELPSSNSHKVITLFKHSPLNILERKNKWLNVKGYKFEGWVYDSLVLENAKCMTIIDSNNASCSTYGVTIKRKLSYLESFKVIKMKYGCNFVEDKHGRRFWLSTTGAWPSSSTKLIDIP
jgi:hypothetical protein